MVHKFYLKQTDNEDEVILHLAVTSILQSFSEQAQLFISTDTNLNSLINKFNWNSRPETGLREKLPEETFLSELKLPPHLLKNEFSGFNILVSQSWSIAKVIKDKNFSVQKPRFKMSFVHSDEVNEWKSLVEATDSLIANWYRYRNQDWDLSVIDLSSGVTPALVKKVAFDSDIFIINKISSKTSQFIRLIRTIHEKAKFIFHAYESSSVYFTNTFLYQIEDYLYEEDLWLMSCEADKDLSFKAWNKINAMVMPLRTPDAFLETKIETSKKHLYYFGRISEQKNLHELLIAVSLIAEKLRSDHRKLKIYGEDDLLGVPNLRIPTTGYLEHLKKISQKLDLEDLVEFHPSVPQEEILCLLKDGIFVTPSVHSDENFGLVAFRALNAGIPVVLTDWGGHKDFKNYFEKVSFIPVYKSARLPHINPYELAKTLLEVAAPVKRGNFSLLDVFPLEAPEHKMQPTDLKIRMNENSKNIQNWSPKKWPLYGKIFESFSDQNYQNAMKTYGAIDLNKPESSSAILHPFLEFSEDEITFHDCVTGVLRYPRRAESRNIQLNQLGNNSPVGVSISDFDWLWENGLMYIQGEL